MLQPYVPPAGYQYNPETDCETAVDPADEWERHSIYHPLRAARAAESRARGLVTYYRNLLKRAECAPTINAAKIRRFRKSLDDAECNREGWQTRIDSILLLREAT